MSCLVFPKIHFATKCKLKFSKKSLEKIYQQLRYTKCNFSGKEYYEYSIRAFIGKQYQKSLWGTHKAKKKLERDNYIYYDNIRIEALSYIYLKRYEEAISIIKKHLFDRNKKIKNNNKYYEKLMLVLIKAYYHRNQNSLRGDAIYLISLFHRHFPNSQYYNILEKWKKYRTL